MGVFETDQILTIVLNDGGVLTNVDINLPANNSIRVINGSLVGMNRNIIDVVSDLRTAIDDTADVASTPLSEIIEVGFQGTKLVLTLVSSDFDSFSVSGTTGDIFGLGSGATSNTNDLLIHIDTDGDLESDRTIAVNLGNPTDIGDVLTAITTALEEGGGTDPDKKAFITTDDPATSVDEDGKSLTVKFVDGSEKLLAITRPMGRLPQRDWEFWASICSLMPAAIRLIPTKSLTARSAARILAA